MLSFAELGQFREMAVRGHFDWQVTAEVAEPHLTLSRMSASRVVRGRHTRHCGRMPMNIVVHRIVDEVFDVVGELLPHPC